MNGVEVYISPVAAPVIEVFAAPQPEIIVTSSGERGLSGIKGDKGDPGDSFIYDQSVASDTWIINHGMGFYPAVTVVDSAEDEVEGDLKYIDANTVQLNFNGGFAGRAFLS
jgi:hypothetical protein